MKAFLLLPAIALSTACAAQTKITFKDSAFYPEGIAYNAADRSFFVGSVKTGTINKVDAGGKTTSFYKDASLKSSFGMKADMAGKKLWICTGDPNYSIYKTAATDKRLARLIALDISTGKKTDDIDLAGLYSGKHFINDLCFDNNGNTYVTDSYSPVIYKIDRAGKASVLVENGLFMGGDIGLNGIAFNNNGYLLTVNNSNGHLLKVNLQSKEVTKVKVPQFFPGADGLLMNSNNELILVQNKGTDKIFKLQSNDNWNSAKLTAATATTDRFNQPSTAAFKDREIYVLNSKLNEIEDPSKKPSEEFIIQQVVWKPVK